MENTLTIYVASLHEHWDMPDNLALKWEEYEKEHPVATHDADEVHTAWYNTLSAEEKATITRRKAED